MGDERLPSVFTKGPHSTMGKSLIGKTKGTLKSGYNTGNCVYQFIRISATSDRDIVFFFM